MSYINETDFVIENKKLVYPEIVSDGLQLYYDAKGKRDTDYHRDTMLDMSGNKNHGKLYNFAYEKHSGYKDGLVFDYIDDKLVRPTLDLQPDDFTFMLNGNIISFSPDGTVKRVQDGEVIESKGFNLIRNGDFVDGPTGWMTTPGYLNQFDLIGNTAVNRTINTNNHRSFIYSKLTIPEGNIVYSSFRYKQNNITTSRISILYSLSGANKVGEYYPSGNEFEIYSAIGPYGNSPHFRILNGNIETDGNPEIYLDYLMLIDLTETFGAGNEPTKEQMDEIINLLGFIPNTQDLIDRIEYKGNDLGDMENIIDGLYKTDILSGEEIYTDKADDAVVHVEVDGKSVGGGSGKNLFYPINLSTSKTYITGLKPNTEYTMSTNVPLESVHNLYFSTLSMGVDHKARGGYYTARTDEDGSIWYQIYPNRPYTEDLINQKYWIQLEEGSTATAYEPPAPTPDYPIEIHSLNDFDVVSSVGGRNLILNSQLVSNSPNNTGLGRASLMEDESTPYYRIIGDSRISTYGFDGSATSSIFSEPMINGATYTVSVDVRAPRIGRVSFFDGNGSQSILKANEWIRIKQTYTYNGMSYRVIGLTYDSSIIDYRNWKIEKGSTATDWTPAPEDLLESDDHPLIDKINLLLDEPLRSVGDVNDRLFRDVDGLWKVERNIGYQEIDSNTSMSLSKSTSNIDYISIHLQRKGMNFKADKNTHLNTVLNPYASSEENIYFIYDSSFRVRLLLGMTLDDYKTFFDNEMAKGVPFTIQYILADPFIETLNQELQDKLNNLRSFEDSNYVYTVLPNEDNTVSNNLKPTLHAKFLYNNWYKEDRVINNLMIYNRALANEEMLQNYKTIKRRWGM